jgi:hypothetical protein
MTQSVAEVLILTINALGAGILMFVAGVAQKIMNELDELEFKRFLNQLDKAAMSDPFAVTIATLPILGAVGYFLAFGFGHWWFTAGFVVWIAIRAWMSCRRPEQLTVGETTGRVGGAAEFPPCTHSVELMAVDPVKAETPLGHVSDVRISSTSQRPVPGA